MPDPLKVPPAHLATCAWPADLALMQEHLETLRAQTLRHAGQGIAETAIASVALTVSP